MSLVESTAVSVLGVIVSELGLSLALLGTPFEESFLLVVGEGIFCTLAALDGLLCRATATMHNHFGFAHFCFLIVLIVL